MSKSKGLKFVDKYGVDSATIYKATADTKSVRIPPPGHALYDPTAPTTFDELRVQKIDADGKMTDPIELWTDPDAGILWVLDGRGRWLDVEEVNRRRKAEGRELVQPYLVPFNGDEKRAVARLREKNYHRRAPTPSGMALDLVALRNKGYSWEDCAKILHQDLKDPEQWGRKLLPIAYCIPEVREAIDAGDIPQGSAAKFGGTALDGSKALGKGEQLQMLRDLRHSRTKEEKAKAKGAAPIGFKHRARVIEALQNGHGLKGAEAKVAEIVAATLARFGGDAKALKAWPEVAAIVEEALKPLPVGRKAKEAE